MRARKSSILFILVGALVLALPTAAGAKSSRLKAKRVTLTATGGTGKVTVTGTVKLNKKRKSAKVSVTLTSGTATQTATLTARSKKKSKTLKFGGDVSTTYVGAVSVKAKVLKKTSKPATTTVTGSGSIVPTNVTLTIDVLGGGSVGLTGNVSASGSVRNGGVNCTATIAYYSDSYVDVRQFTVVVTDGNGAYNQVMTITGGHGGPKTAEVVCGGVSSGPKNFPV